MPTATNPKTYALTNKQGTACPETVLYENEYTEAARQKVESQFCLGGEDDPVAGTWHDCTSNDALYPEEQDCQQDDGIGDHWDDSIDNPVFQGRLSIREHALRQTQIVLGAYRDDETPENFTFEEFKYNVIDAACGNDDVNTPGTYDHDYCGILSKHMDKHPESYPPSHPLRQKPILVVVGSRTQRPVKDDE